MSESEPTETWGPLGFGDRCGAIFRTTAGREVIVIMPCTRRVLGGAHATARVHTAHRRCRGMAAFGASAARRADAAHRVFGAPPPLPAICRGSTLCARACATS